MKDCQMNDILYIINMIDFVYFFKIKVSGYREGSGE